jgi:two-component system sensor histidine kinase/response regulator
MPIEVCSAKIGNKAGVSFLEDTVDLGRQLMMLNRELALERVGGDQELLQEVARLFLDDSARSIREIEAAIAASDAKRLEREAHSLKGSVSNFGAEPVVQAALALEMMGRRGDLSSAPSGFLALRERLETLCPELHSLLEP